MEQYFWYSHKQMGQLLRMAAYSWSAPLGMIEGRPYTDITFKNRPPDHQADYELVAVSGPGAPLPVPLDIETTQSKISAQTGPISSQVTSFQAAHSLSGAQTLTSERIGAIPQSHTGLADNANS
jgi:hypothetical protein